MQVFLLKTLPEPTPRWPLPYVWPHILSPLRSSGVRIRGFFPMFTDSEMIRPISYHLSPHIHTPLNLFLSFIPFVISILRALHHVPHILSPIAPYLLTFCPISPHLKQTDSPYPITFHPISYHLIPRILLILSHFLGPKHIKR